MPQELMKTAWTAGQIDALDPIVRRVVADFLVWVAALKERTGNLPHFEDCEVYVEGSVEYDGTQPHLDADTCAQVITRELTAAEGLVQWVRDDGMGAWSELRDEQPEVYTPAAMFAEVVASWLHDIIGCPTPEDH